MVRLEEVVSPPAPLAPAASSSPYGGGLERLTTAELKAEVARLSALRDAAEARARRGPLSDVDEEQADERDAAADDDSGANAGCAGRESRTSRPVSSDARERAGCGPPAGRRRQAWKKWCRTR